MTQSSHTPRIRYRRAIPLWERIISWPGDKIAGLQEDWALKDWDKIERNLSSKKYHMFERKIKDRPGSSNAHLQVLGGIPPAWALEFPGNLL
ncbi:12478_t:CDS:2 [Acaulospora colombiana]|uniref:12478_t:CDS:1 n=1 Tax=Acaulospora colombiana TaxID=27376 RepID=A0ACA9M2I2_9GLOM|nr:12478_t:CDS:2 [Acaulospora colombiana]